MTAIGQAGWRHRYLLRGLFALAAVLVLAGLFWPWLKAYSPTLTNVVSQIGTSPVAWFVVLILALTASLLPSIRQQYRNSARSSDDRPESTGPRKTLRLLSGTVQPKPKPPVEAKITTPVPAETKALEEKAPTFDIRKAIKSIPNLDFSKEIDPNVLFEMTDEKSIYLKFLPDTDSKNADAVLLVLFGYKLLRELNEVRTAHVTWCLQKSGCETIYNNPLIGVLALANYQPLDAETVAKKCIEDGHVVKFGLSREPKGILRLTQAGANKAADLMVDLIRRA